MLKEEKPGSMISGSFQWTNGHGAERMNVNKSHCSLTNTIFTCYTKKKMEQGMISASFNVWKAQVQIATKAGKSSTLGEFIYKLPLARKSRAKAGIIFVY